MDNKPVRACLCYPHTFAELNTLARLHGWITTADIARAVGCGSGCGLCRPYLAKMLETGETAFALLPTVSKREEKRINHGEHGEHGERRGKNYREPG